MVFFGQCQRAHCEKRTFRPGQRFNSHNEHIVLENHFFPNLQKLFHMLELMPHALPYRKCYKIHWLFLAVASGLTVRNHFLSEYHTKKLIFSDLYWLKSLKQHATYISSSEFYIIHLLKHLYILCKFFKCLILLLFVFQILIMLHLELVLESWMECDLLV